MKTNTLSRIAFSVVVLGGALAAPAASPTVDQAVLTLTNSASGNALVVLDRAADGGLGAKRTIDLGGKGHESGDIDDQGALRVAGDKILAVNPGSNTIAVLSTSGGQIKPVTGSPFKSGGETPISIAVSGDVVYVANQALTGPPNLTGFRLGMDGGLKPIEGSTITFPKGLGAAQVEFGPDGKTLVATSGFQQDGKGLVHSYRLQSNGTLKESAGSPMSTGTVSGNVGFSWDPMGRRVFVSNFRGSAVVVFDIGMDGSLSRKQTLGNGESAACWTAISADGRTLYVANFVSNSISTYDVDDAGNLRLLGTVKRRGAQGADTKDLAISPDGQFLYVLGWKARQVSTFRIQDRMPVELEGMASPKVVTESGSLKGLVIR